jgi:phenylacetic acid degradation operon negative regulatory protein
LIIANVGIFTLPGAFWNLPNLTSGRGASKVGPMSESKTQNKDKLQDKVMSASRGVVAYLADFLLFMVCYGVNLSTSGYGSKGAGRAYARTMRDLYGIGEQSSLRGLERLKNKGYIRYSKGKSDIEITAAGNKRLRRMVPVYEKVRKWDGRLYLVTYDIPEHKKTVRDYFRDHLKTLGCGILQASVWITPYDPREVLRKFIRYNRLEGEVLISYVGKGSNIAGIDLKQLVRKVYDLDGLNKRYESFLKSPIDKWPRHRVAAAFYSILKNDPQLPFKLLPQNWQGAAAHKRFTALTKSRK